MTLAKTNTLRHKKDVKYIQRKNDALNSSLHRFCKDRLSGSQSTHGKQLTNRKPLAIFHMLKTKVCMALAKTSTLRLKKDVKDTQRKMIL